MGELLPGEHRVMAGLDVGHVSGLGMYPFPRYSRGYAFQIGSNIPVSYYTYLMIGRGDTRPGEGDYFRWSVSCYGAFSDTIISGVVRIDSCVAAYMNEEW